MRALTWQGNLDVQVTDVPDPRIQEPDDVIIKVTSTAICGSDLHLCGVLGPYLSPGDVLGHEAMGVVQGGQARTSPGWYPATGWSSRSTSRAGTAGCAAAPCTRSARPPRCESKARGQPCSGTPRCTDRCPGGQAQFLRVPQAQFGPVNIPADGPDQQYLFLSDVLPTAYQAVAYADTPQDGTLAVLGLGPIGQFAARIASHFGTGRVIGVDPVPERRAAAARFGIGDPGPGRDGRHRGHADRDDRRPRAQELRHRCGRDGSARPLRRAGRQQASCGRP